MSKRCKLQKEYYKEFGNYKGVGKYTDHYVNWLESKVLAINYTRCYVSEAEQFFCWDKKGKLSKQCESQCNVCFRYERNNKKNCI